MKNSEVVLIDNFVEKGAESIFCRIFLNLTLHDFDGLDSKLLDTRILFIHCVSILYVGKLELNFG